MNKDAVSEVSEQAAAPPRPARVPPGPPPPRPTAAGDGFALRIYKPGQGFFTRVGTAIGAGAIILWGAIFLFNELSSMLDQRTKYFLPLQYGLTVGFILAMSAVVYWIVGLNRGVNDFFIATEGEMKKVSWSTKQEIIRSTKVVIVTVIVMSVFLFVADLLFMLFFFSVGVLKGGPSLLQVFGKGS